MQLFDMRPLGYTYEYVLQFFRLSEEGHRLYTHVQLPLDLFYPALHAVSGMFSIALLVCLLNKVNKQPKLKMEIIRCADRIVRAIDGNDIGLRREYVDLCDAYVEIRFADGACICRKPVYNRKEHVHNRLLRDRLDALHTNCRHLGLEKVERGASGWKALESGRKRRRF